MIQFTHAHFSLFRHYASELQQQHAFELIEKSNITSEADALLVKRFALAALDLSMRDEKNGAIIDGQRAYHGDLVKLNFLLDEMLDEKGFGHIADALD